MEKAINILKSHGLRKTPFRIQVLSVFVDNETKGLTTQFIESKLGEFDRITLYRTIKTFEENGIVHNVLDSSKDTKYALCHADCSVHNHNDKHAHFLCSDCGETYCLEMKVESSFSLPQSYVLKESHLALSGICAECNNL